jgi:hypothetical protein
MPHYSRYLLFKSSGRRPPRHIHNPSELMFFTRRSSQRIGTGFIFYRKVRPCSQLHRPNTEASQIAEVHLTASILQDERRIRDCEHIVGADFKLQFRTFLPPCRLFFMEPIQDTSDPRRHKQGCSPGSLPIGPTGQRNQDRFG